MWIGHIQNGRKRQVLEVLKVPRPDPQWLLQPHRNPLRDQSGARQRAAMLPSEQVARVSLRQMHPQWTSYPQSRGAKATLPGNTAA